MKLLVVFSLFFACGLSAVLPGDSVTEIRADRILTKDASERREDSRSNVSERQQETEAVDGNSKTDAIPPHLHDAVDFGGSAPISSTKEKRCLSQTVGAPLHTDLLQLKKRDVNKAEQESLLNNVKTAHMRGSKYRPVTNETLVDQEKRLCGKCKRDTNCIHKGNCSECYHWCHEDLLKQNGSAKVPLALNSEQNRRLCESCKRTIICEIQHDCRECDPWCNVEDNNEVVVGMGSPTFIPILGSRFGNDEPTNGYIHTIATIEPGKHLDLICRLLGIQEKESINKLFLMAKTNSKIPPKSITSSNLGEEENYLTEELNRALDNAVEEKKKLSPNEIDDVVERVLNKMRTDEEQRLGSESPSINSRNGETKQVSPETTDIDSKPEEIKTPEVKPKSLIDSIKERFNARNPNLKRLTKLNNNNEDEVQTVNGPIVQPKATLEPESQVDESEPDPVIASRNGEEDNNFENINIKDAEHAKDVLENLKNQVSNARGNEELDRAKAVLERIQTMVRELENNNENPNEDTKRKLDMIEESLNKKTEERVGEAPTINARNNIEDNIPESPAEGSVARPQLPFSSPDVFKNIKQLEPSRIQSTVQELKKVPKLIMDKAQKAINAFDQNKFGKSSGIPSRIATPSVGDSVPTGQQSVGQIEKASGIPAEITSPVVGETENVEKPVGLSPRIIDTNAKNVIDPIKKPDLFETLRSKLRSHENPLNKLESPNKSVFEPKKSTFEPKKPLIDPNLIKKIEDNGKNVLDKLREKAEESDATKTQKEIMDMIKKTHEESIQKQAEMLKKHEENRQNILESIRSKFKPDTADEKKPLSLERSKLSDSQSVTPAGTMNYKPKDIVEAVKPDTSNSNTPEDSKTHLPHKPEDKNSTPEMKPRSQFDENDIIGSEHKNEDQPYGDSKVYFVGDGVKLPLKMIPGNEGAVHLSVDIDKICSCKNSTCPKKRDIAAVVGTILEKEAELKSELESTSHHGLSAKIARSTDKLIKDLENAGFDVQQEIVMFPQENLTVPIFTELKNEEDREDAMANFNSKIHEDFKINNDIAISKNLEINDIEKVDNMESIHEFGPPINANIVPDQPSHLTVEEQNLLTMLLRPETESTTDNLSTTTEESKHQIVNRMADYTIYDTNQFIPVEAKEDIPDEYAKYNEQYDDKLKIKPYKVNKLEDLESTLKSLNETVENSKNKTKTLLNEGTKGFLKNKDNDKTVKKEVDLASNILSFMKSFTAN